MQTDDKDLGASSADAADRVTEASPRAPAGLGPDGSVPTGAAFTPGPWWIYSPDAECPGIEAETGSIVVFGDGDDMLGIRGSHCEREEQLANAALIAAAPELYEACEAALIFIANTRGKPAELYRSKLRAALAKATGDSLPTGNPR